MFTIYEVYLKNSFFKCGTRTAYKIVSVHLKPTEVDCTHILYTESDCNDIDIQCTETGCTEKNMHRKCMYRNCHVPKSTYPQKNRVSWLSCGSCGVVCVILCLAVSVEHRLVTDRQTDTHTRLYGIFRASMASRSNNKDQLSLKNYVHSGRSGFFITLFIVVCGNVQFHAQDEAGLRRELLVTLHTQLHLGEGTPQLERERYGSMQG